MESVAQEHKPVSARSERPGEISWRCSCGADNKHVKLPADLVCAFDKTPEATRKLMKRVFRNVKET